MIEKLFKVEPVAVGAAITASTALLALFGLDQKLCAAIGAFAVAWLVVARQMVAPLPHVADAVKEAASKAAMTTASDLTDQSAGDLGQITDTASDVASNAARIASKTVLKDLGIPH